MPPDTIMQFIHQQFDNEYPANNHDGVVWITQPDWEQMLEDSITNLYFV